MHRHLIPKFVGVVVLLTAFGGGAAYAFTASNTVQGSNAGEGAAVVSGYSVYNIDYSGVSTQGNPSWFDGTMSWVGTVSGDPVNVPGGPQLAGQDLIKYVSFQLQPDNAHWVAVQLYDASGTIVSGGGAGECQEYASPAGDPAFAEASNPSETQGEGSFASTAGIWSCHLGVPMPASTLSYLDVEAVQ